MTDPRDDTRPRSDAADRDDGTADPNDLVLSALLDGELDAAQERALRDRMAMDAGLAARFAELAAVDEALRALPAPDPSSEQLDRMRAGVDRKLARAAQSDAIPGAEVIPLRPRMRVLAPLAAALAAALALYLGLGRGPDPGVDGPDRSIAAEEVAPPAVPERGPQPNGSVPRAVAPGADTVPSMLAGTPAGVVPDAVAPAIEDAPAQVARAPSPEPVADTPVEDGLAAPDEEVAIALDYETLADFELIASLDLLERLSELESTEPM